MSRYRHLWLNVDIMSTFRNPSNILLGKGRGCVYMIDLLAQIALPTISIIVIVIGGYLLRESLKSYISIEIESVKNEYNIALEELRQKNRVELNSIEQLHEAELALRQTVLVDRYEALKTLDRYLHEFDHAIDHILKGHAHYSNRFDEYYKKLRDSAREYHYILGDNMLEAVIEVTDAGNDELLEETDHMRYHMAKVKYKEKQEEIERKLPSPVKKAE